jgi:hypothetical protein
MQPPLLPEETLFRVHRLARRDGLGLLALAGAFALLAAAMGDRVGTTIGLLVAAAGAIELHGAHLLREGEIRAMRWLVASQLYLMAVVLAYCILRLSSYNPALIDQALTPERQTAFLQAGYTRETMGTFIRRVYFCTYGVGAVLTVLYQGAVALYFLRRRGPVARAMADDDAPDAG